MANAVGFFFAGHRRLISVAPLPPEMTPFPLQCNTNSTPCSFSCSTPQPLLSHCEIRRRRWPRELALEMVEKISPDNHDLSGSKGPSSLVRVRITSGPSHGALRGSGQRIQPAKPRPPRLGSREGKSGQGGRGRTRGGERPMGTTADGGKWSKGRAANGDRPIAADKNNTRRRHAKPPRCAARNGNSAAPDVTNPGIGLFHDEPSSTRWYRVPSSPRTNARAGAQWHHLHPGVKGQKRTCPTARPTDPMPISTTKRGQKASAASFSAAKRGAGGTC